MLNIKKVSVISVAATAILLNSNAMAVSNTFQASINVINPLQVTQTAGSELKFGSISKPSANGTVSVNALNTISAVGIECLGCTTGTHASVQSGTVAITGTGNELVVINVTKGTSTVAGITFNGVLARIGSTDCGTATIPSTQTTASCTATALSSGTLAVKVGGTLGVTAATVAVGSYTTGIPYTVTAVYN